MYSVFLNLVREIFNSIIQVVKNMQFFTADRLAIRFTAYLDKCQKEWNQINADKGSKRKCGERLVSPEFDFEKPAKEPLRLRRNTQFLQKMVFGYFDASELSVLKRTDKSRYVQFERTCVISYVQLINTYGNIPCMQSFSLHTKRILNTVPASHRYRCYLVLLKQPPLRLQNADHNCS